MWRLAAAVYWVLQAPSCSCDGLVVAFDQIEALTADSLSATLLLCKADGPTAVRLFHFLKDDPEEFILRCSEFIELCRDDSYYSLAAIA